MTLKIIITSGGTTEKIDAVRMITNTSTGRLGSLIATAFYEQFEQVEIVYICSHTAAIPPIPCLTVVKISNVADLQAAMLHFLTSEKIDAVVHAMAVSDYAVQGAATGESIAAAIAQNVKQLTPAEINDAAHLTRTIFDSMAAASNFNIPKIDSNFDNLMLFMTKTPKIIGMIKQTQPSTVLVGFKLLHQVSHETLIKTAHTLLLKNNCDFVLANDLSTIQDSGHIGFLVNADATYETFYTKETIAKAIAITVIQKIEKERTP